LRAGRHQRRRRVVRGIPKRVRVSMYLNVHHERKTMTTKDFFHFWNDISYREHRLGNLSVRTLLFIAKRTHIADVRHLDVDCSCSICNPRGQER
jgi:hypothetical protein